MSAELILRAAPLLWAAGVSAAAILYARRRYMEAAGTGVCRPRVPKPGLEHEYRGFLRSALIAAAAGTLALIIVERALLGVVDAATMGAAVAALGTLASTYTSAAGWEGRRRPGAKGWDRASRRDEGSG